MLKLLKARVNQGWQYIKNPLQAKPAAPFRGLPKIRLETADFEPETICPTGALSDHPLRLDLGKCIFCGQCELAGEQDGILFSNEPRLGATRREDLIISKDHPAPRIAPHPEISRLCRRSFKLRQVSAAGNNSDELELNALSNVNFDMGRYGIEFVASPRHADGIVITGPVSRNMAFALEETYHAVPDPKVIIICGTDAISGGVFADSAALDRSFLEKYRVDLYIPGFPAHPLTVLNAFYDFLGLPRK
jgi:Ni,Fe-hydrogenase III small subunit